MKAYLKRDLAVLRFLNQTPGDQHSLEDVAQFVGLNVRMTNAALHRLRKQQFVVRVRENGDTRSVVR